MCFCGCCAGGGPSTSVYEDPVGLQPVSVRCSGPPVRGGQDSPKLRRIPNRLLPLLGSHPRRAPPAARNTSSSTAPTTADAPCLYEDFTAQHHSARSIMCRRISSPLSLVRSHLTLLISSRTARELPIKRQPKGTPCDAVLLVPCVRCPRSAALRFRAWARCPRTRARDGARFRSRLHHPRLHHPCLRRRRRSRRAIAASMKQPHDVASHALGGGGSSSSSSSGGAARPRHLRPRRRLRSACRTLRTARRCTAPS